MQVLQLLPGGVLYEEAVLARVPTFVPIAGPKRKGARRMG